MDDSSRCRHFADTNVLLQGYPHCLETDIRHIEKKV
jgi:hypothetical protein